MEYLNKVKKIIVKERINQYFSDYGHFEDYTLITNENFPNYIDFDNEEYHSYWRRVLIYLKLHLKNSSKFTSDIKLRFRIFVAPEIGEKDVLKIVKDVKNEIEEKFCRVEPKINFISDELDEGGLEYEDDILASLVSFKDVCFVNQKILQKENPYSSVELEYKGVANFNFHKIIKNE